MAKLEENNIYFYFNKNKLIDNFKSYNMLGNVYYPLKTNSNEIIVKNLIQLFEINNKKEDCKNGFLISSVYHFELLKRLGVEPSKMCLINVLLEEESIKYLYDNGLRFFTFDDLKSLIDFSKYADLSKVKIVVRLSTMQVFENNFTHLGCNIEECKKILNFLQNRCNNYGMAFYIQNDLKSKDNVLIRILDFIQENYSGFGMSFISIGGINESKDINKELFDNFKKDLDIDEVLFEVGRHLIENAVELETRIVREKTINNKKVVIIKNGIFSGFFDVLLYNKKYKIYLKSKNDGLVEVSYEKSDENDYEFFLCGGSSDSGDKLGTMFINSKYKDELISGAKFCIKNIGAYFEEFFMPYSNDLKKIYIEV